jgi:hypothetical protein
VRKDQRATWFPLLVFAVLAVLVPITFGWVQPDPPWYFYPAVFQGSVLLLGGIGFALTQRSPRSPAP